MVIKDSLDGLAHTNSYHGMNWHVVEVRPQFEILRRRRKPLARSHLFRSRTDEEQQFRLRSRHRRNRVVLAQSSSISDIYADLTLLEAEVGQQDTSSWGLDDWQRIVGRIHLDGPTSPLSPDGSWHGVRRDETGSNESDRLSVLSSTNRSASEAGSDTEGAAAEITVGRFMAGVQGQTQTLQALFDWQNPILTAIGLSVVGLAWTLNMELALLVGVGLWSVARAAEVMKSVNASQGMACYRSTVRWLGPHAASLEEPGSPPLSIAVRLFLIPGFVFVLCTLIYPPAFSLLLLTFPFIAGAAQTFAPGLAPLLHPKALLLLPPATPLAVNPRSPLIAHESSPGHSTRSASASPTHHVPPALQRIPSPTSPTGGFLIGPASRGLVSRGDCAFPHTVLRMVDLHLEDGWETEKSLDGLVLASKAVSYCESRAMRIITVFNCPLETLGQWFLGKDNVYKTDHLIDKRTFVEQLDEHTHVIHNRYKSPMFGVSKRDVVLQMTQMYLSPQQATALGLPARRTFIDASNSVDHPSCPETSSFIRSKVFTAGFICQAIGPNQTEVVNVGCANPEGWIPSKMIDVMISKQTGKLDKLRQCVGG